MLEDGGYDNSPAPQKALIDEILAGYRKYGGKVFDYYSMLSAEHGDILILPYAGGWYDQPPDCISELKIVQGVYRSWLKEENERIAKKSSDSSRSVDGGMTFADARSARLAEEND
jgi:hypothetical protein